MTASSLVGSAWIVIGPLAIPPAVHLTVEFGDDAVWGTSGCNSYRASCAIDGAAVRLVGPMIGTMKMGPEALMTAEQDMRVRLATIASWKRDGDVLELRDAAGTTVLVLRRAGIDDLLGSWTVTALHVPERHAVTSVAGDLHLTFRAGGSNDTSRDSGTLEGSTGCNTVRGRWTEDDGRVSIEAAAATRRVCDDAATGEERALLEALREVRAWRLASHHLTLLRDDGGVAVTMVRR